MIIPVGKKKSQINQGGFKHESILNSEFFKKFATMTGELPTDDSQISDSTLNDVMQDSQSLRLNPNGIKDKLPTSEELPENTGFEGSGDGLTPASGASRSPASQFLGGNPEDENQNDTVNMLQQEGNKIRQYVGNDFAVNVKSNKDGSLTATITPPHGVPINDPNGLVQGLMKAIRGDFSQLQSPAGRESGPTSVTYQPEFMRKVQRAKGGGRK